MQTKSVVCDHCHRDLTATTNSEDYRIVLASERMPCDLTNGGTVTDMAAYPAFNEPLHFCDIACLRMWADVNLKPH